MSRPPHRKWQDGGGQRPRPIGLTRAKRRSTLWALLGVLVFSTCVVGAAQQAGQTAPGPRRDGLAPIVFQLRWLHQFQFAGYYAAVEKGFYRDAGFDVTLVEGSPERSPVGEVLAGRAQYAEGNSEVLYERLRGKPLVALAVIFQHSPSMLLVRQDSDIATPQDLIGRQVMLMGGTNDADLLAMFQNEGVRLEQIERMNSSFDINDLLTGKTDAFNAYSTNEPFFMEQRGVAVTAISPLTYGIDFYSDILFTTEEEVKNHPRRVKAFREATLRGWEYAMAHPAEIIDLLLTKYGCQKTRAHLEFEAAEMRRLILPDLVQVGHMNPGRWRHMADTFVQVGMIEPRYSLEGFIYDPDPRPDYAWARWVIGVSLGLLVCLALVAAWNLQLRHMVYERTAALRESEEKYRTLLENLPQRIFHKDLESRYVSCNESYAQDLDIAPEHIVGKTDFDFYPKDLAEKYRADDRRIMESMNVEEIEETYLKDGRELTIQTVKTPVLDEDGDVTGVLGIFWDITDKKRMEAEKRSLEAQVQHAQKLESLGVLAGGIAHDFNNLLMSILGNADIALQDLSPVSPVRGNLIEIDRASRRAADLCKQMLAYSGKGKFVLEALDLSELVGEMAHMLEVSVSKKAVLRYDFAQNLPSIEGDATQVRQVVMNLITNASDAISDRIGYITVRTGAMECDGAYLSESYADEVLPEGQYVYIEVSDTGCGMDEEAKAKLFDPFFTTKFTGRGLGLSAVLGIVRGHRGAVKLYSEPQKGTSFKVLFPATGARKAPRRIEAEDTKAPWRGDGLVLLVDDEETVRSIGKQLLERSGFSVLTAADGLAAVEVFREHGEEIVCVLLDVTMPHMDGEECFRELRRIRPDVRVVMSSGYSEQDIAGRFSGKGLAGFIQKPYRLNDLAATMKLALLPPS